MYSLLCQHTTVGGQSRKLSQFTADGDSQLSHFHNAWGEDKEPSRMKKWLENHKNAQGLLLFVVMLGTCMLIGDGVLTPAISGEKLLSASPICHPIDCQHRFVLFQLVIGSCFNDKETTHSIWSLIQCYNNND